MSIAFRILAPIALLGTMLAALLALESWQAAADRRHAIAAEQLGQRVARLLAAEGAFASERGETNGLLANPAAATPEGWARARSRRAEAEQHLAAALPAAEALAAADTAVATALARHAAAAEAVAALRIRVDGPAEGRPAPGAWFAATSARIDALVALRRAVDGVLAQESRGDALRAARDALAEAAEFLGRERGTLNGVLAAGRALSPAEIDALGRLRGRQEAALTRIVPRLYLLPDEVAGETRRALALLEGDFAELRGRVMQAGLAGQPWPVAPRAWWDGATAAIGALQAAQRAAGEAIARDHQARQAEAEGRLLLRLLLLAGGLGVVVLAAWLVRRRVVRPLREAVAGLRALAEGRLDAPLGTPRGRDEIAALLTATHAFRDTARQARAMEAEQEAMRGRATEARATALAEVVSLIEHEADEAVRRAEVGLSGLQSITGDLRGAAGRAATTAEEAVTLSRGGRDRAEAAAQATGELARAVAEVAERMAQAGEATRSAVTLTSRAQSVFGQLQGSIGEIGEVSRLIADIAGRTNLLALNATIEAARAGAAGKGFAVVASEVKSLATQTARSTEQIAGRIAALDQVAREVVAVIQGITAAVARIDDATVATVAAVEQQSASARQIAGAADDAAGSAVAVAGRIESLAEDAALGGRAAGDVMAGAERVASELGTLRGQLVGVMRNSIADLDRRAATRRNLPGDGLRAVLEWPGGRMEGTLRDVSAVGAWLDGAPPPGCRGGTLRIAGALPLACGIARRTEAGVGLGFLASQAEVEAAFAALATAEAPLVMRAA